MDCTFPPCSANKDVFFYPAGTWAFQGSWANYGSCPDLVVPLPSLPTWVTSLYFPSLPLVCPTQTVWWSVSPHCGPLAFLAWCIPWVQDPPHHTPLATFCLHSASYHNPPRVLASSPQLRAAAVFRDPAAQKFPWHHQRRWWRHQRPWDSLLIET